MHVSHCLHNCGEGTQTLRRSKVVAAAAASSNSESVGFDVFFHKNSESVGNRLQQKHVQTFGFRIIGHNCQACCSVMHERETSTYIDACMQSSVSTTIPSSSLINYITATATTALCMTAGVVPRRLLFNQRGRFDSIVVGQLFWLLAASSLTPACHFSLQRASIACTWCLPPAHHSISTRLVLVVWLLRACLQVAVWVHAFLI